MYFFKVYDKGLKKFVYIRLSDEVRYEAVTCGRIQRMQDINADLTKCKDEKLKLQAVVADLTQVNRRWQRYNSDMQIFVKKLQATIEEQQEQLNNMADYKVEQLLCCTKDSGGESVCWNCMPIVSNLKQRISNLEAEIRNHSKENAWKTELESDIHRLQKRLHLACDHIENLNRIMLKKGLLKSGYNLLPDSSRFKMEFPCSLDGRKIYECDNELNWDKFKTVNSKGLKTAELITDSSSSNNSSQSHETCLTEEQLLKEQPGEEMSEIGSETLLNTIVDQCVHNLTNPHSPNTPDVAHCSKTSYNDPNIQHLSTSSFTNVSISPINIDTVVSDDDECYSLAKETSDRLCSNLQDSTCSTSKSKSSVWSLSDRIKMGADTDLFATPMHITCPHCATVFPPDSEDSFSRHIVACELL